MVSITESRIMARHIELTEEEIMQMYDRAASQIQCVTEDMTHDVDMWTVLGLEDKTPKERESVAQFLSKIMKLGTIIGIKSASGRSLVGSNWEDIKRGLDNADKSEDNDG